jgi:hypothetical protein
VLKLRRAARPENEMKMIFVSVVSVARGGGGAALFRGCAMTVAPDGAVYVVTQKELWKAAP